MGSGPYVNIDAGPLRARPLGRRAQLVLAARQPPGLRLPGARRRDRRVRARLPAARPALERRWRPAGSRHRRQRAGRAGLQPARRLDDGSRLGEPERGLAQPHALRRLRVRPGPGRSAARRRPARLHAAFETPKSGKVDAHATDWTYEGDRAITGDYLALGKLRARAAASCRTPRTPPTRSTTSSTARSAATGSTSSTARRPTTTSSASTSTRSTSRRARSRTTRPARPYASARSATRTSSAASPSTR